MVTNLKNTYNFTRGQSLDTLKVVYCYCTGKLIINENGVVITKSMDVSHNPKSEIEHMFAWRSMEDVAGGVPRSPEGFISYVDNITQGNQKRSKPAKITGRPINWTDKTLENINDLGAAATVVEETIAALAQDPTAFIPCLSSDIMRKVYQELFISDSVATMNMIISLERLTQHGMWYSCRLFNQIKSNFSFFSLAEINSTKEIYFRFSEGRGGVIIDMMLNWIFNDKDELYEKFEDMRKNFDNIKKKNK